MSLDKGFHETAAKFFEAPTREALRDLLRTHLGETDNCDFKGEWPVLQKVARHILGLANSGGGVIVFGVAQEPDHSLKPIGLNSLLDKADIDKGVRKFLPDKIKYEVLDFSYVDSEYPTLKDKKFQVILVDDDPQHLPFVCLSESQATKKCAIYVRRGTNSEEADYDELQKVINRRLETGYSSTEESTLEEHLHQLKMLYHQISKYNPLTFAFTVSNILPKNPAYPSEDFDAFISRSIENKKLVIQSLLGIHSEE